MIPACSALSLSVICLRGTLLTRGFICPGELHSLAEYLAPSAICTVTQEPGGSLRSALQLDSLAPFEPERDIDKHESTGG
jgi:hypothetical protein